MPFLNGWGLGDRGKGDIETQEGFRALPWMGQRKCPKVVTQKMWVHWDQVQLAWRYQLQCMMGQVQGN